MLDERKMKCITLKAQGMNVTDIAEEMGIARNTYYNWAADEEFTAELARREQEFISSARQTVISYAGKAVRQLIKIAETAESEKVRSDALAKLMDKVISNATKIEIDDGRSDEAVTVDILDKELAEFDGE